MSASHATATPAGAPAATPRRTPAPPRRPRLTVVEARQARLRRGPFVVLVVALLAAGLLVLLLLNTMLNEDAFRLHKLEQRTSVLTDREQALVERVAVEESPARLAARARALGMVPSSSPAFIRAADGAVVGVPAPATPAPVEAEPARARAPRPVEQPPVADAATSPQNGITAGTTTGAHQ